VIRFRNTIFFRTECLLFIAALVFLGLSLLEDGMKLMGISSWLSYFVRTCLQAARRFGVPPTGAL
jgi:hypothetical protein